MRRPGLVRPTGDRQRSCCESDPGHPSKRRDDQSFPTTFPLPEESKSSSMPGDDGIRLDEQEALAPLRPEAGEDDSQKPVECLKPEPFLIGSLQDNELVAESQDFHLQGGSRSQRGCKPGEYRFQQIAHGSGRYQRGIAGSMICIATGFLAGTADQWMSLPGSG